MIILHPFQYVCGAIFFPSLFYVFRIIGRKMFLHKKVPISNKVIVESDIWDIAAKIVTATYGVVSTTCGAIIIYYTGGNVMEDLHWLSKVWARFGFSYYFYDTIIKFQGSLYNDEGSPKPISRRDALIAYVKQDLLMLFHHTIVPIVFYPVIISIRNDTGDFFVGCFYAIDFVVPFIQLRHVLSRLQLKKSLTYVINGIFMTVAFFICRVCIFPFMFHAYALHRGTDFWLVPFIIPRKCTVSCTILLSMQLYWMYVMVRGVYIYFSKSSKRVTKSDRKDLKSD